MLEIDGEAGKTLFEAFKSYCMENNMLLANAAHVIRHDIFQENVKFEGDFSLDKQNILKPFSKQKLVELTLEGSMSKPVTAEQIANNISQLLKLNCVIT